LNPQASTGVVGVVFAILIPILVAIGLIYFLLLKEGLIDKKCRRIRKDQDNNVLSRVTSWDGEVKVTEQFDSEDKQFTFSNKKNPRNNINNTV
jgi:hypothetical protein